MKADDRSRRPGRAALRRMRRAGSPRRDRVPAVRPGIPDDAGASLWADDVRLGGTASPRSLPGFLTTPGRRDGASTDAGDGVPPKVASTRDGRARSTRAVRGVTSRPGRGGAGGPPSSGTSPRRAIGWRRPAWCAVLALAAAARGAAGEPATEAPAAGESAAKDPFAKDAVDEALERAVAYLLGLQGEDGSIDDRSRGRKPGPHVDGNSTTMTSLAILAIASLGHEPGDPTPEGEALRKALDCVLEAKRAAADERRRGYLGGPDGSRMYGHGITTLMLAEMLGLGASEEQDRRIRTVLGPALDLILRSQKVQKDPRYQGGWRYEPESGDADLSVTVWQVMALRAAKNAGIDLPKDAVDRAAAYIRRSYPSHERVAQGLPLSESAFAYQPGGAPTYSTAAAGLLALQVCGGYDDPTVRGAADWLLKNGPRWEQEWFFYGTYYYAQGMYQRGAAHAAEARKKVEEILLRQQEKAGEHSGSWRAPGGQEQGAGRVYSTSLAVLSLSVKYHYLPIYQR